jgi:hypothetical protein
MLLPWILVILVLIAAIAGLIYQSKRKIDEHRSEHHHLGHHVG